MLDFFVEIFCLMKEPSSFSPSENLERRRGIEPRAPRLQLGRSPLAVAAHGILWVILLSFEVARGLTATEQWSPDLHAKTMALRCRKPYFHSGLQRLQRDQDKRGSPLTLSCGDEIEKRS